MRTKYNYIVITMNNEDRDEYLLREYTYPIDGKLSDNMYSIKDKKEIYMSIDLRDVFMITMKYGAFPIEYYNG